MAQFEQAAGVGQRPPGGIPPEALPGGLDEELLALPLPSRRRRFVALGSMAAVVVVSVALLVGVRSDIDYFFRPDTATQLGDVLRIDPAQLEPNSFVRLEGTPMAAHTVHYRRVLGGGEYVVFPLAGQRNVYVHVRVGDAEEARALARREFSGRLVTFEQVGGRLDAVRGYMAGRLRLPVTGESFVLLADEPPSRSLWALGVGLLCLVFIAVNLGLSLRWFRRLPLGQ